MTKEYITVAEMMEMLGICRTTAYMLINTPGFPTVRIGRKILVKEASLHEWLAKGGAEQRGA